MGRKLKDYSHLIGQTVGDRDILNIIRKKTDRYEEPYVICKCKCGRIDEIKLCSLLYDEHRQKCKNCANADRIKPNIQNKTGIRNISFNPRKQHYEIDIVRRGVHKRGLAKTLAEAERIKVRLLEEFENEMNAHD